MPNVRFFEHLHQLVSLIRFDFRSDYDADHAIQASAHRSS